MSSNGMVKREMGSDDAPAGKAGNKSKTPPAKRSKVLDFGLAEKWEDSRLVRGLLRENKRLICWLSEKQVGVITLETLGRNSGLMCMVAEYHCSRTTTVKPPAIDFLKAQDWGVLKKVLHA